MSKDFELLEYHSASPLAHSQALSKDVVVISTWFDPTEKLRDSLPEDCPLTDNSIQLLRECVRALRLGGLLYIYGTPRELPRWGERLSLMRDENCQMVFKYWIALDIDAAPSTGFLKPTHLGLLMFLKSKPSARSLSPFHLNTSAISGVHACVLSCLCTVERQGLGRLEAHYESNGDSLISCMARSSKAINSRFCNSRRCTESHPHPPRRKEGGSYFAHRTEESLTSEIRTKEPLGLLILPGTTQWQELNSLEANRVFISVTACISQES